jgi:ABC-2 type transport system permease protein
MRTVGAELARIGSRRRFWLSAAALIGLHVLVSAENLEQTRAAVARITPYGIIEIFAGEPEPARPALIGWLLASSLQMSLFLPVIAAVAARPEMTASLLATPRRIRLMIGKTVAVSVVLLALAVTIATISGLFLFAEVNRWDAGLAVSADALRGQAAYLVFALLSALPAFAFTLITRSTLGGILVTVLVAAGTMAQLPARFDAWLPLSAGRNLLLDPAYLRLSSGPSAAWSVLAGWALISVAVATGLAVKRDAR